MEIKIQNQTFNIYYPQQIMIHSDAIIFNDCDGNTFRVMLSEKQMQIIDVKCLPTNGCVRIFNEDD